MPHLSKILTSWAGCSWVLSRYVMAAIWTAKNGSAQFSLKGMVNSTLVVSTLSKTESFTDLNSCKHLVTESLQRQASLCYFNSLFIKMEALHSSSFNTPGSENKSLWRFCKLSIVFASQMMYFSFTNCKKNILRITSYLWRTAWVI